MTYFPVDNQTIAYLERTGRSQEHAALVREYFRVQGLFREGTDEQIEELRSRIAAYGIPITIGG